MLSQRNVNPFAIYINKIALKLRIAPLHSVKI